MSKVIVERPRLRFPLKNGSAYPRGRLENQWAPDIEEAPLTESMGRRYGEKWLNENLQPLVRFLRSNVGRPWDKVYSEIAERISGKSAVQKHVLDHLHDYVSEHVVLEGKTVWVLEDYRRLQPLQSRGTAFRFYVDRRSRLLRLAPEAPRPKKKTTDPDRRILSRDKELRRIDGIWYEIGILRIPRDKQAQARCFDVLERMRLGGSAFEARSFSNLLWRTGHYAATKTQLGKRAIARHGLDS